VDTPNFKGFVVLAPFFFCRFKKKKERRGGKKKGGGEKKENPTPSRSFFLLAWRSVSTVLVIAGEVPGKGGKKRGKEKEGKGRGVSRNGQNTSMGVVFCRQTFPCQEFWGRRGGGGKGKGEEKKERHLCG